MGSFTSHEIALMEKMTSQNKTLIRKASEEERQSLEKNVTIDNIGLIQSWLGTKEEIERILFWDKGGKYDDTKWGALKPLDEMSARLFEETRKRYEQLRNEAVEVQMRSDLTLHSQFNPGLLFTGLVGAIRCNAAGEEDGKGEFFRGAELRCIGSVQGNINSITIHPSGSQKLEVHFGSRSRDSAQGILVYTGDSFSLIQLARLVDKDLPKLGYESSLKELSGQIVSLDTRSIRKASRKGEELGYGKELALYASAQVQSIGEAIRAAEKLSRCFYERFGLETECSKIGKKYKNFFIMRDDNFDQLLPASPVKSMGLVLFTATLVCRRCRREIEGFRDLAKSYPDLTFAVVNLASPQSKFYKRVFGDMGGGDPKGFRDGAKGATPFTIIYVPDDNRVLRFAEYYGTGKAEMPPSVKECVALFDKYFHKM
jgi:hypothetical protein